MQNISLACRRAGISRSHFYEIKEAFDKYAAEGLAPQPRRRPRMPNQTPPELEARILEMSEQYPTCSYLRIHPPKLVSPQPLGVAQLFH